MFPTTVISGRGRDKVEEFVQLKRLVLRGVAWAGHQGDPCGAHISRVLRCYDATDGVIGD
jgi:hypothetical protein